jgi:hypothetical protein
MPFQVFLSHSSADKPAVEELARRLAKEGIQAWLDKWHLIPGEAWQPGLEKALAECETCAVFIGPSNFGPWQNEEMRAAIALRVGDNNRRFRVIPVLLPGAERAERSSLPAFLVAATWVEFRSSLEDEDAFHRLVCGIRGLEPGPGPGLAELIAEFQKNGKTLHLIARQSLPENAPAKRLVVVVDQFEEVFACRQPPDPHPVGRKRCP